VDFRAAGDSEGWVTTVGWKEARDVAAAMEWARQAYPELPVILYGQSMGAAAVLRAIAAEGVAPAGIVLESPFDRFLTTVGHRYRRMGLPAFPFAHLLLFWGGVQHGFNPFQFQPVRDAEQARAPALVLGGEHDAWARPAEVRRVAAAMRGPTECVIFTNRGHGRFVGEEYRRVVGNWLASRIN
jgi:alpha-beta hydrolase superfamily lysophospholipase